MITPGWQNVVNFTHSISKEGEKCFVKARFMKSFLKYYKTINESVTCNDPDIFYSKSTPRTLQGHSKGQVHSANPIALGHSRHLGTQAIEHSGTRALRCFENPLCPLSWVLLL